MTGALKRGIAHRQTPSGQTHRPDPIKRKPERGDSSHAKGAEQPAHELNFSDEIKRDSERFIRNVEGKNTFNEGDNIQYDWLTDQLSDYRKLSRKQHYELIARAYATIASVVDYPARKDAVIDFIKGKGRNLSARTSIIRLVIEQFIYYGDESDDKSKKQASKLYSRDVAAIRHLSEQGIVPSKVVEHSEKTGEGLDQWSRKNSKSRKPNRGHSAVNTESLRHINFPGEDILTEIKHDISKNIKNIAIWAEVDGDGNISVREKVYLQGIESDNLCFIFQMLRGAKANYREALLKIGSK